MATYIEIKEHHENEYKELTSELYRIESRRGEIKTRLEQINYILMTAEHFKPVDNKPIEENNNVGTDPEPPEGDLV